LSLSARQNIEKIAGAPRTQVLCGHLRIRNYKRIREGQLKHGSEFTNIGVGGYLYNDMSGPLRKMGFQITYAYHVPLNQESISHLSFGISFNGFLYRLYYGELNTLRDPLIDEGTQQSFVPDANFGIYYYGKNIFAGISSTQLFETPIKWKDDKYTSIAIKRNYFLLAGYRLQIKQIILLEPSMLINVTDNTLKEFYEHFDLNLRVYYSTLSFGTSYRFNDGLVVMGQYQFQNFFVGLAYDYPFGNIWNYTYGNVEVVLGMNLGKGKNRMGDSRYW
jgi:type IX secretion system PorP/SprF family membrane protein